MKLEALEDLARDVGRTLDGALNRRAGERIGFTLILFDFGEGGHLTYLSNTRREEMVATVKEWLCKVGAPNSLVGVAEIAEMAGVTPQAVVNWRVRLVDFPPPLADLRAGPVFDRESVRQWLERKKPQ